MDENLPTNINTGESKPQRTEVNPQTLISELQNANLAPREKLEVLHKEGIKSKLLTPEEEALQRNELVSTKMLLYAASEGENKVAVFGHPHTYQMEDVAPIVQAFEKEHPNKVLVEGNYDEIGKKLASENPDLTDNDVIKKYGEQAYIAWKATKMGVDVSSWDIKFVDHLKSALQSKGPEALAGWMIGQGVRHVLDSQKDIPPEQRHVSAESVLEAAAKGCGLSVEEFRRELVEAGNVDITPTYLDTVAEKYTLERFGTAKTVSTMTEEEAKQLCDPSQPGETNSVIHELNIARDRHAIDVLYDLKDSNRRIVMTAGRSHAVTWQKAISALYTDGTHVWKDNNWQQVPKVEA